MIASVGTMGGSRQRITARVPVVALAIALASLILPHIPAVTASIALGPSSGFAISLLGQHSIESIGRKNIGFRLQEPEVQIAAESPQQKQDRQDLSSWQHSVESIGRANMGLLHMPAGVATAPGPPKGILTSTQ